MQNVSDHLSILVIEDNPTDLYLLEEMLRSSKAGVRNIYTADQTSIGCDLLKKQDIDYWCIHPGGKKILQCIAQSLQLTEKDLLFSYDILKHYGNMSSPTILFVLQKILEDIEAKNTTEQQTIFGAAFGPGLTMETFTAVYD